MEEENATATDAAAPDAAPDAFGEEVTKQNDESSSAADDENDKDTAPPSGRAKRVRKATTNYVPEEETKKEIIIPDGTGEKLQEMPNVVAKFQAITWSNASLKQLYNLVFGVGRKENFKKHLLQFNGLVFTEGKEEAEKDKVLQKIYKLKLDQLKEVMDLCDIDRSLESFGGKKNPDKEMLSNRLIEWLEEPKASGKKLKGTSKKKRKASSTAAAKAPKKPAAKETKKEASKPKKKKKTVAPADDGDVELNIPGVSTDSIRSKIESIVSNADKESVTVKDVRKKLEEWLDMDLVEHKEGIRAMVMDAM